MKPNRAKAMGFRGATRSTFRYSTSALSYWPDLKSLLARARYRFFRISLVQPAAPSATNTTTINRTVHCHRCLISFSFYCAWADLLFHVQLAQNIQKPKKRHQCYQKEKRAAAVVQV